MDGITIQDYIEYAESIVVPADAAKAYLEDFHDGHVDEADQGLANGAFLGVYDSLAAYAEDYCDQIGVFNDVNASIVHYFDFEKMGKDLETDTNIWVTSFGNRIAVFDPYA